jgi:hypothetical protein
MGASGASAFSFNAAAGFLAHGSGRLGISSKCEAGTQQRDDHKQLF